MAPTIPDWLKIRNGTLKPGIDGRSWFVCLGDAPHYEVTPVPAKGKFSCEVRQTINGKHLDADVVYPSADEAVRGGLEELRRKLGW